MTLWMITTTDKYELPLAVADSARELAKMIGLKSENLIYNSISKAKKRGGKSKYKKIIIREDEEC